MPRYGPGQQSRSMPKRQAPKRTAPPPVRRSKVQARRMGGVGATAPRPTSTRWAAAANRALAKLPAPQRCLRNENGKEFRWVTTPGGLRYAWFRSQEHDASRTFSYPELKGPMVKYRDEWMPKGEADNLQALGSLAPNEAQAYQAFNDWHNKKRGFDVLDVGGELGPWAGAYAGAELTGGTIAGAFGCTTSTASR